MKTLNYADVNIGDKIPDLVIPITASLISCAALATRDFEPCHHDKTVAQGMGLPDVFMNILTSQALMARFVTDWSGPEAVMKALKVKLGAPNVPGMTMTVSGEIVEKNDNEKSIKVDVTGENNVWGMHMTGSVQIALP
ncbi:MAG: MaoC/PaaZ C-terminal domain-containing protein [Pseudomonadota bacterium]|nr:MaoC/PaaZ C-terminal domain-containing protein [Pseudomonadota bacterium]